MVRLFPSTPGDSADEIIWIGDLDAAFCSANTNRASAAASSRGIDPVLETCTRGVGWLVQRTRWGLLPQQPLPTSLVDAHSHTNCQHQVVGTCPSFAMTCEFCPLMPPSLENLTWNEYLSPEDVRLAVRCVSASPRFLVSCWYSSCDVLTC